MTPLQLMGLLLLLVFGFIYNRFVAMQPEGFTARWVIVGVFVTLLVCGLDSYGRVYDSISSLVITLMHFAASGFGMTIGSWRRQ